jgi:6-phosphofructokinase 1
VYSSVPIDTVVEKKVVDVEHFYHVDRLRPKYTTFGSRPLFIMTSQV